MKHLIFKANGDQEYFSKQKFIDSIVQSCLAVGTSQAEAETFAQEVYKVIIKWLSNKPEITSSDLRLQTYQTLAIFNPEAAFFYRTFKQII